MNYKFNRDGGEIVNEESTLTSVLICVCVGLQTRMGLRREPSGDIKKKKVEEDP